MARRVGSIHSALCLLIVVYSTQLIGCAGSGAPTGPLVAPPGSVSPQPISVQMLNAAPHLKQLRFSNVLNFETSADPVFVSISSGLNMRQDSAKAHTGRTSLRLSETKSGKLAVRLSSALGSSQQFPADWTMAGAYFYSQGPAQVQVLWDIAGKTISRSVTTLNPGQWTLATVDLATPTEMGAEQTRQGESSLIFLIESLGGADVWCDDVLLIDNTQWFVGQPQSERDGQWTVTRRGLNYVCSTQHEFVIRVAAADAQQGGWKLEEANILRTRFTSTGKDKTLAIFPDGRSYWGGAYRPLSSSVRSESSWAASHASPAQIDVPETMGRLERRSSGDENNDGYNEACAAYIILATGPRLEVTIAPRSVPAVRPMLQISGLPEGEALVTVEGRLVQKVLRLEDGTLLVEIPGRIDRPTTVNVRIQ